jgi:cysteinyl-tRNA synthetase
MTLKIYNTLTRRKEEFKPIRAGHVGIYVCGITAYDLCHVGHARSAIVFDVITRYFQSKGYDVLYVKNFTDVDDKIIARANTEGVGIGEIAAKYIAEHNRDMDSLGVARPTQSPRATEYIGGMIDLITVLLNKNMAYTAEGDVFFSVDAFRGYGKLSGRNLDEMIAGARVDIDTKKKNPLDFVLWKASKTGEPWWDSPWGKGRPGWHIECSVMSRMLLGEMFDIHGGGEDLIFPHHENEIAQSEGASGQIPARYWIHNGFIKIHSEKMSKSLGNVYTIRDILKLFHPDVLRLLVLQIHYRSPIDFSDDSLSEARSGMSRFYSALGHIENLLEKAEPITEGPLSEKEQKLLKKFLDLPENFSSAMDDDFNTARALGHLFDAVRIVNGYVGEEGFHLTAQAVRVLEAARKSIIETGKVLGLLNDTADNYFNQDRYREALKSGLDVSGIEKSIAERVEARKARNWQRADEIRAELAGKGIVIMDSPTGTTWRIEPRVKTDKIMS